MTLIVKGVLLHIQGREQLVDHQKTQQGGPCSPGDIEKKCDDNT